MKLKLSYKDEMEQKMIFGNFIWTYLGFLVGPIQASFATAWLIANNDIDTLLITYSSYNAVFELSKKEKPKDKKEHGGIKP